MPFSVTCPRCNTALSAPDGVTGRSVSCKRCGEVFVADDGAGRAIAAEPPPLPRTQEPRPRSDEDTRDHRPRRDRDDEDSRPARKRPGRRRRERSAGRVLVLVVIGSGALLLCCGGGIGIGIYSMSGAGTRVPAADPQEMAQLKGTWHVTAIEAAGNPVPPDRVQRIRLQYVFDGDKLTVRRPDRPDKTSTFTLDTSARPKRITINQSRAIRAVYAIEGNTLRLCLMVDANPNAGFPAELASRASPTTDVLTLERR